MLLEMLILIVYSRVISYSEIRGRIMPQYSCLDIITRSDKEEEYGKDVAPRWYSSRLFYIFSFNTGSSEYQIL